MPVELCGEGSTRKASFWLAGHVFSRVVGVKAGSCHCSPPVPPVPPLLTCTITDVGWIHICPASVAACLSIWCAAVISLLGSTASATATCGPPLCDPMQGSYHPWRSAGCPKALASSLPSPLFAVLTLGMLLEQPIVMGQQLRAVLLASSEGSSGGLSRLWQMHACAPPAVRRSTRSAAASAWTRARCASPRSVWTHAVWKQCTIKLPAIPCWPACMCKRTCTVVLTTPAPSAFCSAFKHHAPCPCMAPCLPECVCPALWPVCAQEEEVTRQPALLQASLHV